MYRGPGLLAVAMVTAAAALDAPPDLRGVVVALGAFATGLVLAEYG